MRTGGDDWARLLRLRWLLFFITTLRCVRMRHDNAVPPSYGKGTVKYRGVIDSKLRR